MAESLPASRDIDRMRKELEKVSKELATVNKNVEQVGKNVEEVDRKVGRSNATQLGALATALAAESDVRREVLLYAVGMSVDDIAKAVGKSKNAVRVALSRAEMTKRPNKGSSGG
jgi:DNA-directed RNA polymerase specialized sigma24 family protein